VRRVITMAGANTDGGASVYYRFEDGTGRVHIVQSLSEVPAAQRGRAERIEYRAETQLPSLSAAGRPGWQMFGLGFGVALILVLLFFRLPNTLRWFLRIALVGGVVALAASAYFGWIRRTSGLATTALASPTALIDDAKSAVDKMNASMRAQQQQLQEIEKSK